MKLTKINLNALAKADLNEREMCRLLGGSDTTCQCSCAGSSTTARQNSYNNAEGLASDPDAIPTEPCTPTPSMPPV